MPALVRWAWVSVAVATSPKSLVDNIIKEESKINEVVSAWCAQLNSTHTESVRRIKESTAELSAASLGNLPALVERIHKLETQLTEVRNRYQAAKAAAQKPAQPEVRRWLSELSGVSEPDEAVEKKHVAKLQAAYEQALAQFQLTHTQYLSYVSMKDILSSALAEQADLEAGRDMMCAMTTVRRCGPAAQALAKQLSLPVPAALNHPAEVKAPEIPHLRKVEPKVSQPENALDEVTPSAPEVDSQPEAAFSLEASETPIAPKPKKSVASKSHVEAAPSQPSTVASPHHKAASSSVASRHLATKPEPASSVAPKPEAAALVAPKPHVTSTAKVASQPTVSQTDDASEVSEPALSKAERALEGDFADDDAPPPQTAPKPHKKPVVASLLSSKAASDDLAFSAPSSPKKVEKVHKDDDDLTFPPPKTPEEDLDVPAPKKHRHKPKPTEVFMDSILNSVSGGMPAAYTVWKPDAAETTAKPTLVDDLDDPPPKMTVVAPKPHKHKHKQSEDSFMDSIYSSVSGTMPSAYTVWKPTFFLQMPASKFLSEAAARLKSKRLAGFAKSGLPSTLKWCVFLQQHMGGDVNKVLSAAHALSAENDRAASDESLVVESGHEVDGSIAVLKAAEHVAALTGLSTSELVHSGDAAVARVGATCEEEDTWRSTVVREFVNRRKEEVGAMEALKKSALAQKAKDQELLQAGTKALRTAEAALKAQKAKFTALLQKCSLARKSETPEESAAIRMAVLSQA